MFKLSIRLLFCLLIIIFIVNLSSAEPKKRKGLKSNHKKNFKKPILPIRRPYSYRGRNLYGIPGHEFGGRPMYGRQVYENYNKFYNPYPYKTKIYRQGKRNSVEELNEKSVKKLDLSESSESNSAQVEIGIKPKIAKVKLLEYKRPKRNNPHPQIEEKVKIELEKMKKSPVPKKIEILDLSDLEKDKSNSDESTSEELQGFRRQSRNRFMNRPGPGPQFSNTISRSYLPPQRPQPLAPPRGFMTGYRQGKMYFHKPLGHLLPLKTFSDMSLPNLVVPIRFRDPRLLFRQSPNSIIKFH